MSEENLLIDKNNVRVIYPDGIETLEDAFLLEEIEKQEYFSR